MGETTDLLKTIIDTLDGLVDKVDKLTTVGASSGGGDEKLFPKRKCLTCGAPGKYYTGKSGKKYMACSVKGIFCGGSFGGGKVTDDPEWLAKKAAKDAEEATY